MCRIRAQRHNLLGQILRKEHLACADRLVTHNRSIRTNYPVGVDLDVDVKGALDVEAREYRLHFHHAVGICGPHAAEPSTVAGVEIKARSEGLVEGGNELEEWDVGVKRIEGGV